ncbi:hypothetical protein AB5N19_10038 [Seiridium cardinale]
MRATFFNPGLTNGSTHQWSPKQLSEHASPGFAKALERGDVCILLSPSVCLALKSPLLATRSDETAAHRTCQLIKCLNDEQRFPDIQGRLKRGMQEKAYFVDQALALAGYWASLAQIFGMGATRSLSKLDQARMALPKLIWLSRATNDEWERKASPLGLGFWLMSKVMASSLQLLRRTLGSAEPLTTRH